MPRSARASMGGICYHVINRSNDRREVFHNDGDYRDVITLIGRACERIDMRVLGFCLMPNHFHLVLWPRADGDLSRWMQWLMTSQVRRHHGRYRSGGHIWQGRFRAFTVQNDAHLATVLRYVERNPVRAGLVLKAADWPWSSHRHWSAAGRPPFLHPTEAVGLTDWAKIVGEPQTQAELTALRKCVNRGFPYGGDRWTRRIADQLDINLNPRRVGRPKN